jgi:antitoxin component of MazEF toxin-antitoxin module
MADQTNPRKLYQSGNNVVVSFPEDFLDEAGLEKGDRVVFRQENGQITMSEVEWEVASDE